VNKRKIVLGQTDLEDNKEFIKEIDKLKQEKRKEAKKIKDQKIANMPDKDRWRYYLQERQMKQALKRARKEYYGDNNEKRNKRRK